MKKVKETPRNPVADALRRLNEADPWEVEWYRRRYQEVLWEEDTSPVAQMIKDAQGLFPFVEGLHGHSLHMEREQRQREIYQP